MLYTLYTKSEPIGSGDKDGENLFMYSLKSELILKIGSRSQKSNQ